MNFKTGNPRIPEFPWGPVIEIHDIQGLDLIVEHRPQIFENSCGTGKYSDSETVFTLAISRGEGRGFRWEGFTTLNMAVLGAIAQKETGGTQAAHWMEKLLAKETL